MAKRRKSRKRKVSSVSIAISVVVVLIIVAVFALDYFGVIDIPFENIFGSQASKPKPHKDVVVSGDLQIHFLELGNKYTGDCTYIKAGDTDVLIDAGSRTSSISTITSYIDNYCTDGVLEYVIVTHAHQDHYAGFAGDSSHESIFSIYECKTVIDFALTNNADSKMYQNYQTELNKEIKAGATHYTAAEAVKQGKTKFALSENVELEILDSYFYYNKSNDENNYSVCCLINQGEAHYLFTGDLEKEGEKHLVEMNKLPEVEVYKAGHHGSKTSSNETLLSVINPKIVCVCCCAGSDEYTKANENMFPTQAFVDRIAKYTDRVYVTTQCVSNETGEYTSMNGNIVVTASKDGIKVTCSASDMALKDTEWFKKNRTCPTPWKNGS